MKTKAILITLCILAINLVLSAQEKTELKIKVLKFEDGEKIEIDTVLTSDTDHVYFYSDGGVKPVKVDSILKSLGIEGDSKVKFISAKLDGLESEDVKHIWITKDSDIDEEIDIRIGGDVKIIESTDCFTILKTGDSTTVKSEYIYYTGDDVESKKGEGGKKVIISKSSGSESFVWTTHESDGEKTIVIKEDIIIDCDGKSKVKVIQSDDEDCVKVKEVIITKGGDVDKNSKLLLKNVDKGHKIIEIVFDEDDEESKMEELEEALKGIDGDVKIGRYKREDGKIVLKAEITGSDESDKGKDKKSKKKKKTKKK